jgi:2-polyprenyl-3-methyl-5-hydroxy-6-metoxy-1,4-benzoquinol methylase
MAESRSPDFPEYDGRTAEVWDRLAEWWDDKIGDGNDFQNYLIEPSTERLLALAPGERVLDVACGAGRFARRMAVLGARVVAIDHAASFIQRARERTEKAKLSDSIEYHVVSASEPAALLALDGRPFDAAVCTMALMDMSSIEPLLSALPKLLKPGGRFVFSVMHPAFSSGTSRLFAEQTEADGRITVETGVKVTEYARAFTYGGLGIVGQPVLQHYFHRPISLLLNTCFRHGFVMDGMEEPTLPEGRQGKSKLPISFAHMPAIPPVLVARMRLPGEVTS